jgi:ligand-binding sensor domain-containing protein
MSIREIAQRRVPVFRFAAALGLLAAAERAVGQAGPWRTNGPAGGNVYCVASDPSHPSTVYAGTALGVYRSDDGGASWRNASAGLPAERVQTIVIDPTDTATIYVGTLTPNGVASVGIFKSTDGAVSWMPINAGLIDPITGIFPVDVEALAADPAHPGTLLAGTRFSEIFKSTDGGATWEPETLGGFNVALEVSAFQFNPSNPSIVYAASTQGLLLSTDGGDDWTPYGDAGIPFFTLAIDPTSPSILYAGNTNGFGILKSTNSGANWAQVNTNLPVTMVSGTANWPFVVALAVDPSHPSNVYAGTFGNGLFESADGATTWAPANTGMRVSYIDALAFGSGPPATLYAGTFGGGVYQSLDTAATWNLASGDLDLSLVSTLLSTQGTLYAGAFDGVQQSADGGGSWQASGTGLPVAPVAALALEPGAPQTLFAGTLGGGLVQSVDGGTTWTSSAQGLSNAFVSSIAADPSNTSILYAGTADPSAKSERVFKSTDGGGTWTQTSLDAKSSFLDFLAVNPANPAQVVGGSQGATSYFQSLDAGKTWSSVTQNSSCGGVNTILFDPAGGTTYLGATAGVCRSTDGGKTWTVSSVATSASVQALLFDPIDTSILYAGAAPAIPGGIGGVFRSTDGGQTWEVVGIGLETASVTSLAIDTEGALHAGTQGGGVADLSAAPPDRQPIQPPPSTGHHTRQLDPR